MSAAARALLPHLEQVHAKQVVSEEVLARGTSDIIEWARESVRHAVADEAAKLALTYEEQNFQLGLEVRADLVVVKNYSALAGAVREAIAEAYEAGLADGRRLP